MFKILRKVFCSHLREVSLPNDPRAPCDQFVETGLDESQDLSASKSDEQMRAGMGFNFDEIRISEYLNI
jgi:hypothetical protein